MRIGHLSFAFIVLSSSIALADDAPGPRDNTLSVGVTGGVFLPDANVHDFYFVNNTWQPLNSVGPAMGVRVSYDPIRYAAIEIEGEVIPIGTDTTDRTATLFGGRAQLVGQLPARLTPFILGGVGTMAIMSDDDVLGDDGDITMHVGAGAKFFISSNLSIRLDGRWLLAPKVSTAAVDDDALASHYMIVTALTWSFSGTPTDRSDADVDGVLGDADKCPHDKGVAPDGCPSLADADKDGILDSADDCPRQAEVINDIDDEDGCPDKLEDQDGDTVADRVDACPAVAEDMDAFEDHDGCPEPDNDKDGVADANDGCALVVGPADNRGCPENDGDKDGIADRYDNCPREAGSAQFHGCSIKQFVLISQNEIKILESIYFATGSAKIRSRSNGLLDNLAAVLMVHPEITRISVEGHTDDKGSSSRNQRLSQRRAESVVSYLARRGVATDRLNATGHGEESPIADNGTSSGRSDNRRVEFQIERKLVAIP